LRQWRQWFSFTVETTDTIDTLDAIPVSKRLTFIFASLLLTVGLAFINFVPRQQQALSLWLYGALTYVVSALVLRWGLSGIKFVTLLSLPTLAALGIGFTQFFFPNLTLLFRSVLWLLSFFLFYIVYLAENIFGVSADKPIPLYRAARTLSFLATIVIGFLLFTAIYKADLPVWGQIVFVVVLSSILGFQAMWAAELKGGFDRRIVYASLLLGLGVGEAALGLSFFPFKSFFRSVALSTAVYIGLGIGQQYFRHNLTKRSVWEYSVTALIVGFILAAL
jgi:hypothetical protein